MLCPQGISVLFRGKFRCGKKEEAVVNEIDDMRMPEVFWKTETKDDNNSEETESLDEQIKKLKLVA